MDVVTSGNQTLPKMDVSMENSMNIIAICPMVLVYLPTFARTKSPSHVGEYTSTMEHMGSKKNRRFSSRPMSLGVPTTFSSSSTWLGSGYCLYSLYSERTYRNSLRKISINHLSIEIPLANCEKIWGDHRAYHRAFPQQ